MRALLSIAGGLLVSLGMFGAGLAAAIYLLAVEPVGQPGPSVEVADLWSAQPRKVDRNAQHFERIPALASGGGDESGETEIAAADIAAATDFGTVDPATTASVQPADGRQDRLLTAPDQASDRFAGEDLEDPVVLDQITADHRDWCASRYRSYQPENNSYTSYSGQQQPCVSPYTRDLVRRDTVQEADAEPALGAPPVRGIEAELVNDQPVENGAAGNWRGYNAFAEEASSVQYAVDDSAAYAGSDHASYCFNRYRSYRPEDNTYQPFGGGPRRQCE